MNYRPDSPGGNSIVDYRLTITRTVIIAVNIGAPLLRIVTASHRTLNRMSSFITKHILCRFTTNTLFALFHARYVSNVYETTLATVLTKINGYIVLRGYRECNTVKKGLPFFAIRNVSEIIVRCTPRTRR